jgi:hypothetical protein
LSSTASVSTPHGVIVGFGGSEFSTLALEFAASDARVRPLLLEVASPPGVSPGVDGVVRAVQALS